MQKIPLLLTRPEGSNARFLASLPPALTSRIDPVDAPLMRIRALAADVGMDDREEAIFTSASAIGFAPAGQARRAHCVGTRTTAAARAAGWQAVCAGRTAEELIETMLASDGHTPLVHFSGTHVRGGVVEALVDAGRNARRVVLYDQELLPLSEEVRALLSSAEEVLVPLFSPRAASCFARECPAEARVTLVALSPAVAAAAAGIDPRRIVTAADPDAASLVACLEKLVAGRCSG